MKIKEINNILTPNNKCINGNKKHENKFNKINVIHNDSIFNFENKDAFLYSKCNYPKLYTNSLAIGKSYEKDLKMTIKWNKIESFDYNKETDSIRIKVKDSETTRNTNVSEYLTKQNLLDKPFPATNILYKTDSLACIFRYNEIVEHENFISFIGGNSSNYNFMTDNPFYVNDILYDSQSKNHDYNYLVGDKLIIKD